ncbi:helix-turn-helix domain-containing protein [Amycolatopsis sp. cmx-4-68]|uniref:helix-turn-helix domain-containing protein n=1 Tax=Amycolatopsis sp. cmx-4-68 TaxID=2790938 RepID=UPI00397D360C
MAQVLAAVRESAEPLPATGIAERLGISRATAQRSSPTSRTMTGTRPFCLR